jgi:hypothetical protein
VVSAAVAAAALLWLAAHGLGRLRERRAVRRLREQREGERARAAADTVRRTTLTPERVAAWARTQGWSELALDDRDPVVLRLAALEPSALDGGGVGFRIDGAILWSGRIVRVGELFPHLDDEGSRAAAARLDLALRTAARAIVAPAAGAPRSEEFLRVQFFPVESRDVRPGQQEPGRSWPPLRFQLLGSYLERPVDRADAGQLALRLQTVVESWYRDHMVRRR